jgi:hypothetical protein
LIWNEWFIFIFIDFLFETISRGDYACRIHFPALSSYLLAICTSLKIDGGFFFYVQNEMLCTIHIIVFSIGNSFPIALLERYSALAVVSGTIHHQTTLYPCNITSRSLIIARLSESNKTKAQSWNMQYLVSACIIS